MNSKMSFWTLEREPTEGHSSYFLGLLDASSNAASHLAFPVDFFS
jgi:hypothetical protein